MRDLLMKGGLCGLLLVLLSACAPKPPVQFVPVGNDSSMMQLNRIAEQSERSTRVLAQIQQAQGDSTITLQGAKQARLAMTATPKGWGRKTSVSFQGPFNKLLETLSTRADYQFYTRGQRPANLTVVTIDAHQKTLKSILDQVVAQLPHWVSVAIYPRTHSVILTYRRKGQ